VVVEDNTLVGFVDPTEVGVVGGDFTDTEGVTEACGVEEAGVVAGAEIGLDDFVGPEDVRGPVEEYPGGPVDTGGLG